MTTMPADFLIDGEGVIVGAYYGKDEGDHLPMPEIFKFAKRSASNVTTGLSSFLSTQGYVPMIIRLLIAVLLSSFVMSPGVFAQEGTIAAEPTATKPLEKGQKAPDVKLKRLNGKDVSLASLHQEKPLVIVFFRGGWCPICTKHTQQLIKVYPELKEKGFEMIGVSPDSVESTKANIDKGSIPFPLYSDSELKATTGFGLAFTVDDATLTKYKGFGIDLEKASGQTHHALPSPAIYIVSKEGLILFAHSNPDYRQRLDAKDLLKELGE